MGLFGKKSNENNCIADEDVCNNPTSSQPTGEKSCTFDIDEMLNNIDNRRKQRCTPTIKSDDVSEEEIAIMLEKMEALFALGKCSNTTFEFHDNDILEDELLKAEKHFNETYHARNLFNNEHNEDKVTENEIVDKIKRLEELFDNLKNNFSEDINHNFEEITASELDALLIKMNSLKSEFKLSYSEFSVNDVTIEELKLTLEKFTLLYSETNNI